MSKQDHMRRARGESVKSPMNTKVGALIVAGDAIVTGYNKIPDYVTEEFSGHILDDVDQHAERTAINRAARTGVRLNHSTLYVTHTPCPTCAGALIDAGIAEVIICEENHIKYQSRPKWESRWKVSAKLLSQAKVRVEFI